MTRILFSPLGGTDPIHERNWHDGSMLHIARHYRPDKIILYMSKEICDLQDDNQRFTKCIQWLGEKLDHSFDVEMIKRTDLMQVQLFNSIYEDFERILDGIVKDLSGDDQLILNISSGTPAMKSALLVLATMIEIPCECVQVDTPDRKMNEHVHNGVFSIEELWEFDYDNQSESGSRNRCHSEKLSSLRRLKLEEVIKKQVKNYEYHAAVMTANMLPVEDTKYYFLKLKIAEQRQLMNQAEVDKLLAESDFDDEVKKIYRPVYKSTNKKADRRTMYEYMLLLQSKVKQGYYVDFVRGLTPLMFSLFLEIYKKLTQDKTFEEDYFDDFKWKKEQDIDHNSEVYKSLVKMYKNGFNFGGMVSSDHLAKLIYEQPENGKLKKLIKDLHNVETKVRNIAAHEIVYLSDEKIKERSGSSCEEIIMKLKKAFNYTNLGISKDMWDSYENMNDDILKTI